MGLQKHLGLVKLSEVSKSGSRPFVEFENCNFQEPEGEGVCVFWEFPQIMSANGIVDKSHGFSI